MGAETKILGSNRQADTQAPPPSPLLFLLRIRSPTFPVSSAKVMLESQYKYVKKKDGWKEIHEEEATSGRTGENEREEEKQEKLKVAWLAQRATASGSVIQITRQPPAACSQTGWLSTARHIPSLSPSYSPLSPSL